MYIKRRFKFPNEEHFINNTVKFGAALLKHVKLAAFQSLETAMMFPEMFPINPPVLSDLMQSVKEINETIRLIMSLFS